MTAGRSIVRIRAPMASEIDKAEEKIVEELQRLIVDVLELEDLTPGDISPDKPLFTEDGVGLDSIDAMELGVALKRRYKVTLNQETEDVDKHFATVASLARFVIANKQN